MSGEATNQPAKEAEVRRIITQIDSMRSPTSLTKVRYRPNKIVILEALSATGLRSIRYAKEIPLVK